MEQRPRPTVIRDPKSTSDPLARHRMLKAGVPMQPPQRRVPAEQTTRSALIGRHVNELKRLRAKIASESDAHVSRI
jgi:hypothetical protein